MKYPMWFKNSGILQVLIFCSFIFVLLPVVKTDSTIDEELMPRFFFTSVFIIACSVYYLFDRKHIVSIEKGSGKIFGVLVLILVWTGLSMIRSVNPGDAFSEWLRLAVLYGLLFVSYLLFSQSGKASIVVCRSALFAVIIFSGFAFFQIFSNLNEFQINNKFQLANVVSSTLTNKNFFSEVLVLLLPLLVNGLMSDKKRWKYCFALVTVLDFGFIIFLQTIAAWLAVFVSLVFFFIFSYRSGLFFSGTRINRKHTLLSTLIVLIIFSGGLFYFSHTSNYKWFVSKIDNTVDYVRNPSLISETRAENNNSVFERLLIWRNSFRMISDHPVIGAGLNNWKILNPSYGIGGTQFTNSGMMSYEHPHNDYLLIWAEQGPVGIILYILLFYLVGRSGLRKLKTTDKKNGQFIILLCCGVISFSVMSLFAYPRSRFYEMILLMIMFSLILSGTGKDERIKIPTRYILIVLLIISSIAAYASFKRVEGEVHIKNTLIAQLSRNFPRMQRESDKAYSWWFPLDITATPVSWYKGMASFYSNDIPSAIDEYEKALVVNPNHIRVINDLATSYERNKEPERAIALYRKSLSMIPLFVEGNLNLSATYYNFNKIDSAFYFIDKIYSLPMSMAETNNYDRFLDAILFTKAYNMLSETGDSVLIRKWMPIIEDKKKLKQLYFDSKAGKIPFYKF